MATISKQIKIASVVFLFFTIITGVIYPALITVISQIVFSHAANGSLIKENNTVIGSALIGQYFSQPKYFWGRPSATTPFAYNAANSSGSNLGPLNPDLLKQVKERVVNLKNNFGDHSVPIDLVTTSASGLDPEISPLAAFYQVPRIAKARGVPEEKIRMLIENHIQKRFLGILGEPRVNVLELNLALDSRETNEK